MIDSLSSSQIVWLYIGLINLLGLLIALFKFKNKLKKILFFLIISISSFLVIPNLPIATNYQKRLYVKTILQGGGSKQLKEDVEKFYLKEHRLPDNIKELTGKYHSIYINDVFISNERIYFIFNKEVKNNTAGILIPTIKNNAIIGWQCLTEKISSYQAIPKRYLPKECEYK